MANNSAPSILTTHEYIVEAFDDFAETTGHDQFHQFRSVLLDPTVGIKIPHMLEATLTVPIVVNPQTGVLRASGARTLEIELLSDLVPRSEEHVAGYSKMRWFDDDNIQQNVLAGVKLRFNTRRLLDVNGRVFTHGLDSGIDQSVVLDGSKNNWLLTYLAHIVEARSLSVSSAEELVAGVSLYNEQSLERFRSRLDVGNIAQAIRKETGVKIPASLKQLPSMSFNSEISLIDGDKVPRAVTKQLSRQVYTVDSYRSNMRAITEWALSEYMGPVPADSEHLTSYGVSYDGGESVGFSIGIDVSQETYSVGDENYKKRIPESGAEARDMVKPFINAVSSLRRYYNATHRDQ